MFMDLKTHQCALVFQGLRLLIESGQGSGFYNADQGHPFYVFGAKGQQIPGPGQDDEGPHVNSLYMMLCALNDRLEAEYSGAVWWYDFRDWSQFCKLAIQGYEKKMGYAVD